MNPENTENQIEKYPEDIAEPVEIEAEPIDIMEIINEPNIRLGTDYRKTITFTMNGKKVKGVIRPISSDELARCQTTAELNQGSTDRNIVQLAFYGADGKRKLPAVVLDKLPGGVTTYIASQIMDISGYNIPEEALFDLKKE